MSRFIPEQLKVWTQGELLQTEEDKSQSDRFYRGISTDTRKIRPGEVFLALKGPRFNGHDFLEQAIDKGALLLVIEKNDPKAEELRREKLTETRKLPDLLFVEDCLKAYQKIAEGFRRTLLATVVGITGSVGKTTSRRMISSILSTQMKVHQTQDNLNNQIGLPLTLLQADDADDAIVAEMGMDHRGEIGILSEIAHPDISIITSIGYSHAEYLGSREEILKEKTDIVRGMKANGLVLINGQDRQLNNWALTKSKDMPIWRILNSADELASDELSDLPTFWADHLEIGPYNTSFVAKSSLDPQLAWPVEIPVPGKHLVRAALFGLAAAYFLGLDMAQAVSGCRNFKNTGNRQRLVQAGDILLIDDSYNSSPESNTAALETLQLIADAQNRRKVVCLSGMRELGRYSADLHKKIGCKIGQIEAAEVYLVGNECEWVLAGLESVGFKNKVKLYETAEEVSEIILSKLQAGDCVLVKGSRFYEMEQISKVIERSQWEE